MNEIIQMLHRRFQEIEEFIFLFMNWFNGRGDDRTPNNVLGNG